MTPSDPSPPTHGSELGASLRKARGTMTQTELADRAQWGTSGKTKVSKIESGKQLPSHDDLETWAAITGADERLLNQWRRLATDANADRSNYRKRAARGQQPVQKAYSERAEETTNFTFFETAFIPRYLQIPEYSRLVLREHHEKHGSVDDVEAAVRERQLDTVLPFERPEKQFRFLIDEPVLRRRRVPPAIMRPQLGRLLSVIGLPNVELAVFPSLSVPVRSHTESSFEIFDDVAYIETVLEDGTRRLADDVIVLEGLFARFWQDAAAGDDAQRLILDAIASLPAS